MRKAALIVLVSSLVAVASLAGQAGQAPSQPKKPQAVASFEHYTQRLLAAAEAMPADGYTTRLAPGVRSFGEAVGHSIDTNFGVCAGARRLDSPTKGQNFELAGRGKSELVQKLREAFDYCASFVADAAAAGTHASDVGFLTTHNAQMLALMDAHLIAAGQQTAKGSEAAAPVKK